MTNQPSDDEKPFYSKASFLLAAAFVTVVAVIGIVLALTAGGDEDDPPDEAATSPASTETAPIEDTSQPSLPTDDAELTSSAPPPAEGDCPPLSGDAGQDALQTAPTVEWYPVGEVAPAFSQSNGPALRDGVKECFAQTPAGALLAGYNFLADLRTWQIDPQELVATRVDPASAIYDELAAHATQIVQSRADGTEQREGMTVQGYRFLSAADSEYTIALVHTLNRSTLTYTYDELTVQWVDGDWKVTSLADIQEASGLPEGFIAWGPRDGAPE